MKSLIPLRWRVSFQFGAITLLPVVIIALLVWLQLIPLIKDNITIQHKAVARAIAGQISAHLMAGERQLTSVAETIAKNNRYSAPQVTALLDATCGEGELFETIYIAGNQNKLTSNVGLARLRRLKRDDFLDLDISGRNFSKITNQRGRTVWSKTFLSTVSGQMAIAVTILLEDTFIVGEITLANLSEFISHLPVETELRTMVLDQQLHVVADSQQLITGQQLPPGLLSANGNNGAAGYISFILDGYRLVGSVVDFKQLNWEILVTQPYLHAFKSLRAIFFMVAAGLAFALIITLTFAWYQAGKLSKTVQIYTGHAKTIADGKYNLDWPSSQITEAHELATSLKSMAQTISKREQQLIASEDHLSITLNSIGDAVITTDENGLITRLNRMAEKLTGWTSGDAFGQNLPEVFNIINNKSQETVPNPVERVLESCKTVGLANHTLLIARDGREYQISDSAAPIRSTDGTISGVVLVFRDITEGYDQQQKIKENESRLRELTANVPGVVYQCRATKDREFVYEFMSTKTAEIFGLNPTSETFFKEFYKHLPDEDQERYLQSVQESINEIKPWYYKGRFNQPNGEEIWFSSSSIPKIEDDGLVFYGVLMDITWRKQLESSLHLAQFCFNKASIGIFRIGKDGQLLDVNEQACFSLGYTHEELSRKFIFDIDPNFKADMWSDHISRVRKSGSQIITTQHQRKNGEIFPVQILFNILTFEGQEFHVAFVTDMSEWEQSQKEQKKLEKQLQQSQKLEAIGKLAGGVAHDINNLLTPILGYSELLLIDPKTHEQAKEKIESIIQAGKGARDLVGQLLAFSRKQVLEYKPLNINKVITGFENLIRRTIREDIEIIIINYKDLPSVMADVGQIEQVIMNLLINAADAMPEGGKLTIETSVTNLDNSVSTHPEAISGNYVMLAISDTGTGMDEETQSQIFEPFFTTKGDLGTGLGLATVYGIIKQHNGNILVYSEPDKGTTFKIYLPASTKENFYDSIIPPEVSTNLSGTETILLVEDNMKVRKTVNDMLQQLGYSVLSASGGTDALDIMSTSGQTVDLLLTDVVMPGMNGNELFAKLSQDYPTLKVLYMSGYTDNSVLQHGVLDEGVQFIQKPFSWNSIAAKVRELIEA